MATEIMLRMVIDLLLDTYPRAVLKEGTLAVYEQMLADIPDDALLAAVRDQIRNNEYFPSIAAIVRAAAVIQSGSGSWPSAMDAWGEICGYMRAGQEFQPKFSNVFIDQIVTDMCWYNLRMSENQAADRARFIESYDAKVAKALRSFIVPVAVQELTARNAREFSQSLLADKNE